MNFINQRNEPHHEKERVKISNTAKFQSCRPNTRGMASLRKQTPLIARLFSQARNGRQFKNPKLRDKCMAVRHGELPTIHFFIYLSNTACWFPIGSIECNGNTRYLDVCITNQEDTSITCHTKKGALN